MFVGILKFMTRTNFMNMWVEHEQAFYNFGPWCSRVLATFIFLQIQKDFQMKFYPILSYFIGLIDV